MKTGKNCTCQRKKCNFRNFDAGVTESAAKILKSLWSLSCLFVNESDVIVRSIKNRFSSFDFFPKLGRSSENDQKPNQNKRQIRIEKILIRRSELITQLLIRWVSFRLENIFGPDIVFFVGEVKGQVFHVGITKSPIISRCRTRYHPVSLRTPN